MPHVPTTKKHKKGMGGIGYSKQILEDRSQARSIQFPCGFFFGFSYEKKKPKSRMDHLNFVA